MIQFIVNVLQHISVQQDKKNTLSFTHWWSPTTTGCRTGTEWLRTVSQTHPQDTPRGMKVHKTHVDCMSKLPHTHEYPLEAIELVLSVLLCSTVATQLPQSASPRSPRNVAEVCPTASRVLKIWGRISSIPGALGWMHRATSKKLIHLLSCV